jgi:DNA end-binding protein Ku
MPRASGPQIDGAQAPQDRAHPAPADVCRQDCSGSLGKENAMPRAIWSGSISFGLLNVPVKLYSAVSKKSVSFRELRASDGSRIRHKRVAEADGEEVSYDEIVKGYEIAPDQYVRITREELDEIDPKKTRAIEIQDFVDLDEIDPIYFDHPYYLGPAEGAEKPYALLTKAMGDSRKVAIARFVLRNKEHLAAIRPLGNVLTMATMRFADEVAPADEVAADIDADGGKPKQREVEMAKSLIESLTTEFDPSSYRDEYREELLALIERKARGEEVVEAVSEAPQPTKAPDLMAALEESLAAVRGEELGAGAGGDGGKRRGARAKSSSGRGTKSKSGSSRSRSDSSSKRKKATKSRSRAKAKAKK